MKRIYILLLVIISVAANAQQRTVLSRYGAGNGASEFGRAQAIDVHGNIFIAGDKRDTASLYGKALLVKYSASGTVLWSRSLSYQSTATDVKTDPGGNAYIGIRESPSFSEAYISIIKYDPYGNMLWNVSSFDSLPGYDNFHVTLDNSGNVFGIMNQYNGDLLVLKYSSNGALLWSMRYPGNPSWQWWYHSNVQTDAAGNLYISGGVMLGSYDADLALMKISPAGSVLWIRQDQGTANKLDYAMDMEVDAQGNTYVTGLENYTGQHCNTVTLKYDTNGNLLWKSNYDNSDHGGDQPFDLMLSASGDVYVTGSENRYNNESPKRLGTTIKYDSNGNELWAVSFGDSASSCTTYNITEDISGNVYVAGTWRYPQSLFVASISKMGVVQWTDTCLSHIYGSYNDSGLGINISPLGGAYVAATMMDENSLFDIALVRYGTDAVSANEAVSMDRVFDLYPNPSNGKITIAAATESDVCMEVIDISGRKIGCFTMKRGAVNMPVDVSYLSAGSYMVRAVMNNDVYTKKLVIVK